MHPFRPFRPPGRTPGRCGGPAVRLGGVSLSKDADRAASWKEAITRPTAGDFLPTVSTLFRAPEGVQTAKGGMLREPPPTPLRFGHPGFGGSP